MYSNYWVFKKSIQFALYEKTVISCFRKTGIFAFNHELILNDSDILETLVYITHIDNKLPENVTWKIICFCDQFCLYASNREKLLH